MSYTSEQMQDAIKCANEHDKIVIPIEKRQLYLNNICQENYKSCTFDEFGFRCPNLICVNNYITKQFSEEYITENLKVETDN